MLRSKLLAGLTGLLAAALLTGASAASISSTTGITVLDTKGNTWNLDDVLNSGKVVVVHQTFIG